MSSGEQMTNRSRRLAESFSRQQGSPFFKVANCDPKCGSSVADSVRLVRLVIVTSSSAAWYPAVIARPPSVCVGRSNPGAEGPGEAAWPTNTGVWRRRCLLATHPRAPTTVPWRTPAPPLSAAQSPRRSRQGRGSPRPTHQPRSPAHGFQPSSLAALDTPSGAPEMPHSPHSSRKAGTAPSDLSWPCAELLGLHPRTLLPSRPLRLDSLCGRLRLEHLVHALERPHRPTDIFRQVLRGDGLGKDKRAIHGKSIDRTSASEARRDSRSGRGFVAVASQTVHRSASGRYNFTRF